MKLRGLIASLVYVSMLVCTSLQAAQQNSPTQAPVNPLAHMFSGGDLDMAKVMELVAQLENAQIKSNLAKAAARRERLTRALPDAHKELMMAVFVEHQKFAETLKFEPCCIELCQKVYASVKDSSSGSALALQLEKFHTMLQAGAVAEVVAPSKSLMNPGDPQQIMQMLFGAMQSSSVEKKPEIALSDIRDTRVLLQALVQCEGASVLQEAQYLLNIVQHIENKMLGEQKLAEAHKNRDSNARSEASAEIHETMRALASSCFASRVASSKKIVASLKEVGGIFSKTLLAVSEQDQPELHEAYKFFIDQLRTYSSTHNAFMTLYNCSEIDLSLVMKTMSQMYDIARIFFDFKRFDPQAGNWAFAFCTQANLIDHVFKGSIATLGLVHKYTENASGELQKLILEASKPAVEYKNPLDSLSHQVATTAQSLWLLINPTAYGTVQPVKRALLRVALAMTLSYDNNNPFKWQSQDEWMRVAFIAILKELQVNASDLCKSSLVQNVDPALLENIETYSMGLIKPELVDLCFDIVVPMFLMQKQQGDNYIYSPDCMPHVIDFHATDMFKYEYSFLLHMMKRHEAAFPGVVLTRNQFDAYVRHNFGYFIEYRILQYVLRNVGFFWGSFISKKCKNQIYAGAKLTGKGISKILELFGIIEADAADEAGADAQANGGLSELNLIKELITSVFYDGSPVRLLAIGFLKNNSMISQDVHESRDINDALANLIIRILVNIKLMSYTQAAKLMNTYLENPSVITPFMNELFERVEDNLTGAVGGMIVGGIMGYWVAPQIMSDHGPFVLK